MNLSNLITILTFCFGAAFTIVDIGTDVSLAYEYFNNCHICQGRTNFSYLFLDGGGEWSKSMQAPWRKVLPNGLNHAENSVYALLTTLLILLGGLAQFTLGNSANKVILYIPLLLAGQSVIEVTWVFGQEQ